MEVRVAYLNLFKVSGNSVLGENPTIAQVANSSSEIRVIEDPLLVNTTGNPTIAQYLALEAVDTFKLQHLSQTMVITYKDV